MLHPLATCEVGDIVPAVVALLDKSPLFSWEAHDEVPPANEVLGLEGFTDIGGGDVGQWGIRGVAKGLEAAQEGKLDVGVGVGEVQEVTEGAPVVVPRDIGFDFTAK